MHNNSPAICPNCDTKTELVILRGHYGNDFFVDQCQKCGGLWFDGTELFRAKPGEGERMTKLNLEKFRATHQIKAELYCPRDGSRLELFKASNFPSLIEVERCNTCFGFWFNQGEFHDYQIEQGKLKSQKKNANMELKREFEFLKKFYHKHNRSYLVRISKFLLTPMYYEEKITEAVMRQYQNSLEEITASLLNIFFGKSDD